MAIEIGRRRWWRSRGRTGPHMIYTEAETLEAAAEVLERRARAVRRAETMRSREPGLRQELAWAKNAARTKAVTLSDGVHATAMRKMALARREKLKTVELSSKQKAAAARELWRMRAYNVRDIARLVKASVTEVKRWIDPKWEEKARGGLEMHLHDPVDRFAHRHVDWGTALQREKA